MRRLKAVNKIGDKVTVIMTKASKEKTHKLCTTVPEMFKSKILKITNVFSDRCTLSDGWAYSVESFINMERGKKKVCYTGTLNNDYTYFGVAKSGIIEVGCQEIKVTDQLIKELKLIQKPKRRKTKK